MISNFKLQISNFIAKMRALPENRKKIIFFAILTIAALIIGFFEVKSTARNLSKIGASLQSIKLPSIGLSDSDPSAPLAEVADTETTTTNTDQEASANATPDSTLDWQTYQNNQHAFTVQYPKDFFTYERKSLNKEVVLWTNFASTHSKEMSYPRSALGVQIIKSGLLPKDWIQENFKEGIFAVNPHDIQEVQINNLPAFQFKVKGNTAIYHYTLLNPEPGTLAILLYNQTQDQDSVAYPADIYQNFISTFTYIHNR